MNTERWGIVGGGMLGMSLALWLRDQGHEVTLLEAAPEFGGLASVWEVGDITWDRHYHVILNSDRHLLSLLDRLDLTEQLEWVETRTGVYSGGQLYSVSNAIEYLKYPPLRLVDKMRMGWTIVYGSRLKNWRKLEQQSVETWLRRHSGNRAFDTFWLPLLRSKLGDNYKKTSAAFIWTTIQRLYAARRSGLKKEMFGYVDGGYRTIIDRFVQVLSSQGVTLAANSPASSIRHTEGVVEVATPGGTKTFDKVIVTTASPIAAKVIEGLDDREAELMRGVEYQGIVCASLLASTGLGGFYVTNITDPAPFTGVIEMSALVDRQQLGGHHLVYLPRYTVPGDEILKVGDDQLEEQFVSRLSEMFPNFTKDSVEAFRVSRVGHVFPIPTIDYSSKIPPIATSVPGVFTVNSSQILNGTLNVNETLLLAARAMAVIQGKTPDGVAALEADQEPVGIGAAR